MQNLDGPISDRLRYLAHRVSLRPRLRSSSLHLPARPAHPHRATCVQRQRRMTSTPTCCWLLSAAPSSFSEASSIGMDAGRKEGPPPPSTFSVASSPPPHLCFHAEGGRERGITLLVPSLFFDVAGGIRYSLRRLLPSLPSLASLHPFANMILPRGAVSERLIVCRDMIVGVKGESD